MAYSPSQSSCSFTCQNHNTIVVCHSGLGINFHHLGFFDVHLNLTALVFFSFHTIKMWPLCFKNWTRGLRTGFVISRPAPTAVSPLLHNFVFHHNIILGVAWKHNNSCTTIENKFVDLYSLYNQKKGMLQICNEQVKNKLKGKDTLCDSNSNVCTSQ